MKEIHCFVELQGGFGNQLFQLNFANYLKKNNFEVYIRTKLINKEFQNVTKRKVLLPLDYFDLKNTRLNHDLIIEMDKKNKKKALFNKYFGLSVSEFKGHNFDLKKVNKYNYFLGYWKNMDYLDKDYIKSSLSNNKFIKEGFERDVELGSSMLHIRRGDYIPIGWDLNIKFYEKSLALLKEKSGQENYDIFTDDYEFVKSNKLFKKARNIFYKDKDAHHDDTIETFSKMLNYDNYIVGNSSFSFWAAYLRTSKNSIVIIADPWFSNHNHPTLKKETWFTVPNL